MRIFTSLLALAFSTSSLIAQETTSINQELLSPHKDNIIEDCLLISDAIEREYCIIETLRNKLVTFLNTRAELKNLDTYNQYIDTQITITEEGLTHQRVYVENALVHEATVLFFDTIICNTSSAELLTFYFGISLIIDPQIITSNSEITLESFKENYSASMDKIDEVPIYKGCKSDNNRVLKDCFSRALGEHIAQNFNTRIADRLDLPKGIQRIFVSFTINKKGRITKISPRASHPALQSEAKRVLELVPRLKPGTQDGEPVNVKYAVPIVFKIT